MSLEIKPQCPTCRHETDEAGHLCVPTDHHDEQCEWCGALLVEPRHLCGEKVQELAYICNSCGRAAVSADQLCQPVAIE